jgi:hypothetical protein
MEGFREAVQAASEPEGDTSAQAVTPETSATETLAAQPEQGTPERETPPGDTEQSTAPDSDLRSYLEKRKAERPELADEIDAIHREVQRGLTPKLQEAAELRRQMEQFSGIDPEVGAFMRQVNELALVNPAAARDLWDQAKQQLFGPAAPAEPQAAMPEDWEFATETERSLYQRMQTLEQKLNQTEAWKQQETEARNRALMARTFEEIKNEFGQEVPQSQREAAAKFCVDTGLGPDKIGIAWRGLYGVQAARQAGRNEAAGLVERKAAMTPGPSAITTPPAGPLPEPKSLREAIERAAGRSP